MLLFLLRVEALDDDVLEDALGYLQRSADQELRDPLPVVLGHVAPGPVVHVRVDHLLEHLALDILVGFLVDRDHRFFSAASIR